jgi:hypothetical protein
MRGNGWKLHETVRLAVLYCGGVDWEIIDKEMVGRSISACGVKLKKLNIPRDRKTGPKPNVDIKDSLDWDIWGLRQEGLNKREIADKLGLDFHLVKNRMYNAGLHLHPPAGEPPEGVVV